MRQIAFLTDLHLNEDYPLEQGVKPLDNFRIVIEDLENRKIKELIFGGDIGHHSGHQDFLHLLNPFAYKLVLGNHDEFSEVSKFYNPGGNGELYYSDEKEEFKFIYLDSSKEELSSLQLAWIKEELNTKKKILLFIHHPVLAIPTPVDKLYPLKNRDALKQVLLNHQQEVIIFCGHYHSNDECSYRNIRQITTQALSYQIVKEVEELQADNSTFGYLIIKLHEGRITTELVSFRA